jgi:hypothetical protein
MALYDLDELYDDNDEWSMRVDRFADPGGDSALYAAGPSNPRDLPCPTCGWPNRLTRADRAAGYQCDSCAVAQERGMDINYYEGEEVEDDE